MTSMAIGTSHVDLEVRPLREASHKTIVAENGKYDACKTNDKIVEGTPLVRLDH